MKKEVLIKEEYKENEPVLQLVYYKDDIKNILEKCGIEPTEINVNNFLHDMGYRIDNLIEKLNNEANFNIQDIILGYYFK